MCRGLNRFLVRVVQVAAILAIACHGSARADGVDVDFDAILKLMDGVEQGIADTNANVADSDIIKLYGQDRDGDGIQDQEQLAMLSAILMGNYTYDSATYGTNQLTPATVAAIQAGFVANKSRINTDLTLDNTSFGSPCFYLQIASQSCNMADLISQGNADTKNGLLSLLAAYMTLGELGDMNYNGTGLTFVEVWFENLIDIALRGGQYNSFISPIKDDLSFNAANYQKFGSAGTNYLGASGNIDSNTGSLTTNFEEYTATANREEWLTACHITPPLRVVTSPSDVTHNTGESEIFACTIAGGLFGLGFQGTQSRWSDVVVSGTTTTVTEVRGLQPNLEFDFPYLTVPVGQTTHANTYFASIEDGVWKRASQSAVLTVNLDANFRITEQPVGGEYASGAPVTLHVATAGGNQAPTYQWIKDSVAIDGATSATYSFAAAAGGYWCVINGNTDGAAKAALQLTSDSAVITLTPEGAVDGEGVAEGIVEGTVEGVAEGALEGVVEGVSEGIAEGIIEGVLEGVAEGTVEGVVEGVVEGEAGNVLLCTVPLTGAQVSPPTVSSSSGTLSIYSTAGGGRRYMLFDDVLNPTGLTIGTGGPCANGGAVRVIDNANSIITIDLTPEEVAQFDQLGDLYIVVRSDAYPDGEIRGVFGCQQFPSLECSAVSEGEGNSEGTGEGSPGGEGTADGAVDGEGTAEGLIDPCAQWSAEGELSGHVVDIAAQILGAFGGLDQDHDGLLSDAEVASALVCIDFGAVDLNADQELRVSELLAIVGGGIVHTSDTNGNGSTDLDELLRVIQLYNAGGYACAAHPGDSEDGYEPGQASKGRDTSCLEHDADYQPAGGDGVISLSELLRLIQVYAVGHYHWCPGDTEDGYCLDAAV